MTRGGYIGGHTVWNGRHSSKDRFEPPRHQSRTSARLLGSTDRRLVEFGEALLSLEMEIGALLEQVALSSDGSTHINAAHSYMRARTASYSEYDESFIRVASDFEEASRKQAERQKQAVADLTAEMSSALEWAEAPERHMNEIAGFVQRRNRR